MQEQRTVLFADVSGSTRILEQVGDTDGWRFIAGILEVMSHVTHVFQGQVIKTIGDEVMSCFVEPMNAILAAVEMQRRICRLPPLGTIKPRIKVGIHGGLVLFEGGDIYGDVVNVAARVTGMAKADQILTTADTLMALGNKPVLSRSLGSHTVWGKGEPVPIHEVLWEESSEQLTTVAPKMNFGPPSELLIRLGEETMSMSGASSEVRYLGRGEENAICVADGPVSRSHAAVASRGGRFYISDQSTNGTYVRREGGEAIFVHRDEVLLRGTGAIRLGRAFTETEGPTLEYRIEQ